MVGGELAFDWRLAASALGVCASRARLQGGRASTSRWRASTSRTSTTDTLSPANIEFDAESMTSIEAGIRASSADGRLRADIGVFVARRDDQQIKVPLQLRLGDPSSFLFVTANSERGEHHGIEATIDWQRDASGSSCRRRSAGCAPRSTEFSLFPELAGREQAHAPAYTYSLGATYRAPSGWWGAARSERHGRVLLRLWPRSGVEVVRAREFERRARMATRGASSSGRATYSTRSTSCAASTSATSRRTFRRRCTRGSAIRGITASRLSYRL